MAEVAVRRFCWAPARRTPRGAGRGLGTPNRLLEA